MNVKDRAIDSLLGLALGDAVGTTLEFRPRDSYRHITKMKGGGPFGLKSGQWTDDTSMAVALGESLAQRGRLDQTDLMNRFVNWWRHGLYSSTGECFDIGTTTKLALRRYETDGNPVAGATDERSAGNGSLMRLAPIAIWGLAVDEAEMRQAARDQSATTHGAAECLDACEGYAMVLRAAILGTSKVEAMAAATGLFPDRIGKILSGGWKGKPRDEIGSSGYVAHSLEAALWCVDRTDTLWDAVLLAANLGDDADTTAAITGQLAGALHGTRGVPRRVLSKLHDQEGLVDLAERLLATPHG